jgi:hypothetical protein
MLRFRPRLTPPPSPASPPDLLAVGQTIDELMQPGHFFVAGELHLHWTEARAEDVPWEVFRGRLVDAAHTRQRARFLSWHITEDGADSPLLSVRLDVNAGAVHVTRGILCYVWEGYDTGGGVIESREVQRWTCELVGSAELHRFADLEDLRDELNCLIWQAIVGTSRLPLHSVEAPLPAFSLGQLHYVYQPWAAEVGSPVTSWQSLVGVLGRAELFRRERARLLEFVIRTINPTEGLAATRQLMPHAREIVMLLRTVFNEISLSPHTGFADMVVNLLDRLHSMGRFATLGSLATSEYVDFLGHLLRLIGRHLTAYDLITFHHGGTNYPDALLLEALLPTYIQYCKPACAYTLFTGVDQIGRLRRRALRQAFIVHRNYFGHHVPDMPTSPGENARVLPLPRRRVPDEQLSQPHRRLRTLFAELDLAKLLGRFVRGLFTLSLHDLVERVERIELGVGLFIDRPLGYGKSTGEPDVTPMLAHVAFSPSIARRRFHELMQLADELSLDLPAEFANSMTELLAGDRIHGLSAVRLAEPGRPTAALADVRRVADDFVIVRTLPGGLGEMLRLFDFSGVKARFDLPMLRQGQLPRVVAMVRSARGPVLGFFDDEYQCRLECTVDESQGFIGRAGIELPKAGLRVVGEELRIPLTI